MDGAARSDLLRRVDPAGLGAALAPRRRNLVYISIWAVVFGIMQFQTGTQVALARADALLLMKRSLRSTLRRSLKLRGDDRDSSLAFKRDFVRRLTRSVALRVGRKVAAMKPTIEPGDAVLIDQNLTRRRRPPAGRIFAISEGPLTGTDSGGLQRVELADRTLILSSDNPDKSRHAIRTFDIKGKSLPDILVGEVVWFRRYLGRGKRR